MRLYVIGGQGQIARSLREASAANDDIIFGCAERPDVDLLRPNSVAQALANFGPDIVIHLSTDYVFDGTKDVAYVESDPASPRSVYGQSKYEGELAVATANPRHIV